LQPSSSHVSPGAGVINQLLRNESALADLEDIVLMFVFVWIATKVNYPKFHPQNHIEIWSSQPGEKHDNDKRSWSKAILVGARQGIILTSEGLDLSHACRISRPRPPATKSSKVFYSIMSESAETTRKRQPHFYGFVWLGGGRYAILQVFLECDLKMGSVAFS